MATLIIGTLRAECGECYDPVPTDADECPGCGATFTDAIDAMDLTEPPPA